MVIIFTGYMPKSPAYCEVCQSSFISPVEYVDGRILAGIPVECINCGGWAKTGSKEQLARIDKPYSGKGIEIRAYDDKGNLSEWSEAVLVDDSSTVKLTETDTILLENVLRNAIRQNKSPEKIIEAIEAQVPNSEGIIKLLKENVHNLIAFMALVVSMLALLDTHFKESGNMDTNKLLKELIKTKNAVSFPAKSPNKTRKSKPRRKAIRNSYKKKK